jgi:nucleotide-binding universal stress UspA family protein
LDKILLAVDGSEHSLRAAAFAGELSKCLGAPVCVVHVVPSRLIASAASLPAEYVSIEHLYVSQREMLESAGDNMVRAAGARVRQAGGEVAASEVYVGSPAAEIAAAAETLECDCIVLGRRGLGDVGGLLLGSVSHKVGHLTDKTLITVQ